MMSSWFPLTQRIISVITRRPHLFAFTRVEMGPHGNATPRRHAWQVRLGKLVGPRLFSLTYPEVPGRVHVHDTMLVSESPEHIRHYISVGTEAADWIEATLKATQRNWSEVAALLDMGSGFGRVLRQIACRMDARRVTACEIDPEAVRFCRQEFGATPLVSAHDFAQIAFPAHAPLKFVSHASRGWDNHQDLWAFQQSK